MAKNNFKGQPKCSFCGKIQEQVRKLIAAPGVYICDECVDLCNEILDEEFGANIDEVAIPDKEKFQTIGEEVRKSHMEGIQSFYSKIVYKLIAAWASERENIDIQ